MKKGFKHTKESKIKIGLLSLGRKVSIETRKKISNKLKGKLPKNWHPDIGFKKGELNISKTPEFRKEQSERYKGDKCNFWNGGIAQKYTIDWTKTFRESIRERDKYLCQICGEKQSDRAFSIHHIDYNKKNCNPDNLITLCLSCHGKTNTNRKYWQNLLVSWLKTKI